MTNRYLWFIPPIAVAIGIFLLSTFLSFPVQVEGVSYLDKIEHCFAYLVLTIGFLIAFKKAQLLNHRIALAILISASTYGFSLELAQYIFFPNRFFEWIDACANVLGSLIGFGLFKLIFRG
ncbi:VanZ family protein [Ekhidna sp.]